MLLQAEYRLTVQDFNEAQAHGGWLSRFLQIVGVIIILSALPSLFTREYAQGIIGFVVGSLLAFGTRLSASRTFKKETSLQLGTNTIISEEGLVITTPSGESKLNWSAFVRYTETKNIFMVYVQSRMFHIIPKRALPAKDILTLREILSRHITGPSQGAGRSGMQALLFAFVVVSAIVLVYLATHASHR